MQSEMWGANESQRQLRTDKDQLTFFNPRKGNRALRARTRRDQEPGTCYGCAPAWTIATYWRRDDP